MAYGTLNFPHPTRAQDQRSINVDDLFLARWTPPWARPSTYTANQWRTWVLNQPIAIVCRETLIANLLSLDWKIVPRNSKYKDELDATIRHYSKLFTNGGEYGALGLDYSGLVEWVVGDLLDTAFGGAAEIGRRGDEPGGRVYWIRPIDAGTLFPTLNEDYPVVQYYNSWENAIAFPYWSIVRTFMSPHSSILREGWGMAPPEKIFFAMEMLNRGDKYYANLLLDIPTAGILDLGDMSADSAQEWITAFKTFVADTSQSFRIPVLYEHNNPIEWIPFGKVPNDIMFHQITTKYAAVVAAAYGMSLSDIGLQTATASGETLAGSIRQERRTRKTGHARVKSKVKAFFDRVLPATLEFKFVDYDDELNVALGRARLASGQSFAALRQLGLFSPQELRSQWMQDGLISISLPEELPPDAKPDPLIKPNGEPELVKDPKPPSSGGEGKSLVDSVSFKAKSKVLDTVIEKTVNEIVPKIRDAVQGISDDELDVWKSSVAESIFGDDDLEMNSVIAKHIGKKSIGSLELGALRDAMESQLSEDGIENAVIGSDEYDEFDLDIRSTLTDYISKAILFMLNDEIFTFDYTTNENYNLIVKSVQERIASTLPELVKQHVLNKVEEYLERIRRQN